jgi:hypothetical protein
LSDDLDPKGLGFPVYFFSFIPLISLLLSPHPPPNLFLNTIRSKGKEKRQKGIRDLHCDDAAKLMS